MRTLWFVSSITVSLSLVNPTLAQELPPIFANTSQEIVNSEALAEFSINTFLESVVVGEDGTLFFTSHEEGQILQLFPEEEPTVLTTIGGKATGLALTPEGSLLLTAIGEDNQ